MSSPNTQLQNYLMACKRRWLPACLVLSLFGSWAGYEYLLARSRPIYLAEGKLRFALRHQAAALTGLVQERTKIEPLSEKTSLVAAEVEVLKSPEIIQATIDQLQLKDAKQQPLRRQDFLKQFTVEEVRNTDLARVGYRGKTLTEGVDVVNTMLRIYLDRTTVLNRQRAKDATIYLEQELPDVLKNVRRAEEALRQFKERHQVISLKEDTTTTLNTLTDLQRQNNTLRSQLADVESQVGLLQQRLGKDASSAVTATVIGQTPGVQDALKQLQQVEVELTNARSIYQEDHVEVVQLRDRWQQLRSLVQDRVTETVGAMPTATGSNLQAAQLQQDLTKELVLLENRRQGLIQQLTTLSGTTVQYQQRASNLPQLEQQQRELERQLEASQTTYSQMLKRREELNTINNQNVSNAEIVSPAILPEKPLYRYNRMMLVSLLGILAAGATIGILEMRDRRIKTVDQAKDFLGFSLLGVIPWEGKVKYGRVEPLPEPSVPHFTALSRLGSAYRMLQSNLKFASSDRPLRIMVVTSSVAQEGKSSVSANLALAMAAAGQRVLIIDADLHQPVQHRVWQLNHEVGLSHLLAEGLPADRAIQSAVTHVDVLTAGVVPPNALVLLDSQRMSGLLQQLAPHYDAIIIDTPPLNCADDALILGRMADGVLFVIRPGWVEFERVEFAKTRLEQSAQTVIGQVVNGISADYEPAGQYYYLSDNRYLPMLNDR
jgi:polysaccharide biosynthesis transport protein